MIARFQRATDWIRGAERGTSADVRDGGKRAWSLLVALRVQRRRADHLQAQGALDTFLTDVDELYAEFRKRFEDTKTRKRPN
jgi:hypothetical protein